MRKGYAMSEDRRRNLAGRGLSGFRRRAPMDPGGHDASEWRSLIHRNGPGAPGLSVTHRFGDTCETQGIGCERETHSLVHRDSQGAPVAYAQVDPDTYDEHDGKAYVSRLASDRTRGVAHALAVGHIARHLDKMHVEPSHELSTYSQRFISHGFEMKETGRDSKLKNYLARRSARIPQQQRLFDKGYKISDERMHALSQNYGGFNRRGINSEHNESAWRSNLYAHGRGKPGLSINHQWGDACHKQGIGCDEPTHEIVHRDRAGSPVAYARILHPPDYERPYVGAMASDRTRGITHALAVGHIANHLDNMGVEPDTILTGHSQRLVSHGFEMKETGRDTKLKDYLARRSARVQKGYKASPESRLAARQHLGNAGPAGVENVDRFAQDELSRVPHGKPGLSVHRNTYAYGGGWNGGRFEHESRAHTIVYRDNQGIPVTSAGIYGKEHHWGKPDRRVTSTMVSDRRRGALHAIGTAHVANALQRLHADTTKEMTHESQRMVAHSLDRPERTSKLRDYIAKRAKRGN